MNHNEICVDDLIELLCDEPWHYRFENPIYPCMNYDYTGEIENV